MVVMVAGTAAAERSPSGNDVIIAVAISMGDRYLAAGQAIAEGARAAVNTINAHAGLTGGKVRVSTFEGACDDAVQIAKRIAELQPALVLGHPCDRGAIEASRVYRDAGVLFVATAVRHPDLTRGVKGATIFRLAGRDDRQGEAAGRYLLGAEFDGARIGIVHDRTRFAKQLAAGVRRVLADEGRKSVIDIGLVAGTAEYDALVARLIKNQVEVLFFAGFGAEAAILYRGLLDAGRNITLVGADVLIRSPVENLVDGHEGSDIRVTRALMPVLFSQGRGRLFELMRMQQVDRARAAVDLWASAVEIAGSLSDANAIARVLRDKTFATQTLGSISFDQNGDASIGSYDVFQRRKGRWRPVEERRR